MKSRTSFFNGAAFRKNLTRFAPAWILYSVLMLMFLLSFTSHRTGVMFASTLADMTHLTAVAGLIYAFLNAQLLFGDLYQSRMCNALHAMPIRREGWFITNAASGLVFCLVPNAVFAVLFLALSGGVWESPLLWFAVSGLQYVFFFGVAVLSAYCVGNRFAMALVYGILNFLSLILYWLVSSLYEPLLYGITVPEDTFTLLCPVLQLTGNAYYSVSYDITMSGDAVLKGIQMEDGWLYLAVCAVLGLSTLVLALVLYRRRNLECAGDFVAIRRLGPVFLVLYTFCAGACCHGFFSLLWGGSGYGFLVMGLVIGFFTGLMLLNRTVRVIRKKNMLAFLGLIAVFGVSLILTAVDPLGITRWVPESSQVKTVQLSTGSSIYKADQGAQLQEKADIEKVLAIHEHCLRQREDSSWTGRSVQVSVTYTLRSGAVKHRQYVMLVKNDAGLLLAELLSRPEVILGNIYTKPQNCELVRAEFTDGSLQWVDNPDLEGLVDAIIKDCEAGVMAQDWAFMNSDNGTFVGWLYLETRQSNGIYYGRDIRFDEDCTNIIAWLEANSDFKLEDYVTVDGKFTKSK